jgi:outer membrane protein OmpA-like peptidoglycan-associated protein
MDLPIGEWQVSRRQYCDRIETCGRTAFMHWIRDTAAKVATGTTKLRGVGVRAVLVVLAGHGVAHAQAPLDTRLDTVGTRAGSIGVHALAGGFVGRLDLHGGGETHLLGARAGAGFGELVQLTGFYWRAFDRAGSAFTADAAWGAELQLNLNTGFGVAPYLSGGLARVGLEDAPAQTAALAGAGLMLPLGPVIAHAGAHNYMFGVTGLRGDGSPEDVTHNWKYSAGILFAVGRGRGTRPVLAARSAPAAELAALRDSLARARAAPPGRVVLDSVLLALMGDTAFARTLAGDTLLLRQLLGAVAGGDVAVPRNYQSAQRVEIPLPTEGSITLRYGPEPPPAAAAAAAPVIVQLPGTAPVSAVAVPDTPPPVAVQPPQPQLQQQPIFGVPTVQPLAQAQLDALAQQLLAGMTAALLPRLEASQAQRFNALRDDLRRSLGEQQAFVQRELARLETSLAPGAAPVGVPPTLPPATPPVAVAPDRPPATAPPATPVTPTDPAAELRRVELARQETALEAARAEAALRTTLADAAARQPVFLATAETERGPALVLAGSAFTDGAAGIGAAARGALAAVAEVLLEFPDRAVFVQAHTDASAAELQSQRLSELRAETVRSLLVQAGVPAGRIHAIGYGHARPAADSSTARGRALNRRVEIVLGAHAHAALQR